MSKGLDLIRRRERVVSRGVGRMSDLTVASADGAMLTDTDGREYIDFAGGIGVMNVGHCDEEVVRAIREQAGELLHASIHVGTYEPYVALCEKLVELFPHGQDTKAMLVNTGAEAVENAIKIARQATGRSGVICFTGAFHGRTLMATTLTSKVNYKTGFGPYAPEVYRIEFPVWGQRRGITEDEATARGLERLRACFRDTVSPDNVAAIIIEPVQGEGGFYVAPAAYLHGLRTLCDEHGIMLIIDEVQTGFGRTGRWAAYEHAGVTPDLSTWAKSMGGGLPISAVIGRADVMDRAAPGTLGGTYGGNPVACAAALATIRRMEAMGLNKLAELSGVRIRERFDSIAQRVREVVDVRGLGCMIAIELAHDGDPARPAGALVKDIIATCQERGLIVIPAGVESNVIRVLAPLIISDETLDRGLTILDDAIVHHTTQPAGAGTGA